MKTKSTDLNISKSTIQLINARSKDDVQPAHTRHEQGWFGLGFGNRPSPGVYEFLFPKCAVKNGQNPSDQKLPFVPQSSGSVARTLGDQYKVYWRHI